MHTTGIPVRSTSGVHELYLPCPLGVMPGERKEWRGGEEKEGMEGMEN